LVPDREYLGDELKFGVRKTKELLPFSLHDQHHILNGIHICDLEWSIEHGHVAGAQKLRDLFDRVVGRDVFHIDHFDSKFDARYTYLKKKIAVSIAK
jgi:hypothetical protein